MARRGKLWIIRGMWSLMGSTAPALIVVDVEILTMTQGETSWLCMTFFGRSISLFFQSLDVSNRKLKIVNSAGLFFLGLLYHRFWSWPPLHYG